VGETLKAYKGCLLKLRQQQQLYIEEQDDQHLFEVEHGILDILGKYVKPIQEIFLYWQQCCGSASGSLGSV
jgi:hypothetical protein